MNGHYRSLDYVLEGWTGTAWKAVANTRVTNNTVQGWREHRVAVSTDRLRLHVTRSKHGNRMGLGELEVYAVAP